MALTREFKDTVMEMCKDPNYRKALLIEALESYLEGDMAVGNALLRDYLNGCKAFSEVAEALQINESGLRRMLSPKGNPTVLNFFRLFSVCQKREGFESADDFLSLAHS
jgi:DNA-binding phage protein